MSTANIEPFAGREQLREFRRCEDPGGASEPAHDVSFTGIQSGFLLASHYLPI